MNHLTVILESEKLKDIQLSGDVVEAHSLINALSSLDNRLCDMYIVPEIMTSADIIDTLSAIVGKFGGNNH